MIELDSERPIQRVGDWKPVGAVIDEALAELLANRIAERVALMLRGATPTNATELIDAAEVARMLGCERSWVCEHKAELGVIRLGGGARPRLRFERATVEAVALGGDGATEASADVLPRRRRPRQRGARRREVRLLEIKGNAP